MIVWMMLLGLMGLLPCASAGAEPPVRRGVETRTAGKRVAEYARLPLSFARNEGQVDGRVKYVARGPGYTLFLTSRDLVLKLRSRSQESGAKSGKSIGRDLLVSGQLPASTDIGQETADAVGFKLLGANPAATVTGLNELPGKSNYFFGNDPKNWRTNVPNYAKVFYKDVYPGVDLVYYGNQGRVEYDFVVEPGGDASAIALRIENGNSKFEIRNSKLENQQSENPHRRERRPGDRNRGRRGTVEKAGGLSGGVGVGIQDSGGKAAATDGGLLTASNRQSSIGNRKFLDGRYVLTAGNRVHFEIPKYDRSKPLVIDPVLTYATYLGDGRRCRLRHRRGFLRKCLYGRAAGSIDFPVTLGEQSTITGNTDTFYF